MFKNYDVFKLVFYYLITNLAVTDALLVCHDDPTFNPQAGLLQILQFTWLGTLQYIHIKNGNPHYFRVPRVVLISRQFALSTAIDAGNIPDGYALGNVIFGDYERDDVECRLTEEEVSRGADCVPALMLMPIADVLLHPEYKHFGVKHSIALLKLITPVKSKYMLPVCVPFIDYIQTRSGDKLKTMTYYHLDYTSEVPRDFSEENKEIIIIEMLPKELCALHKEVRYNETDVRDGCSDGCGLRSGAPTVAHEPTGHWTVVALSRGGSPCPDPLRDHRPTSPPAHTLVHPYTTWILNAITGRSHKEIIRSDPFGAEIGISFPKQKSNWVGKWWYEGIPCNDRSKTGENFFKFYHEPFIVEMFNDKTDTNMVYLFEIVAPANFKIACVKIGVPERLGTPTVSGIDTQRVKVTVTLRPFYMTYAFEVEAWGSYATDGLRKHWRKQKPVLARE